MAYKLPGEMCLIAKVSFDLGQNMSYLHYAVFVAIVVVIVVVVDIVGVFGMTPPPPL
jgi:ABC-type Mn2+/Zn2+ transport system permease subunit